VGTDIDQRLSKTESQADGSKLKTDSEKIFRAMRASIVRGSLLYQDKTVIENMEIIGLVTSGLQLRTYRMVKGEGMYVLLERNGPLPVTLPQTFVADDVRKVLKEVIRMGVSSCNKLMRLQMLIMEPETLFSQPPQTGHDLSCHQCKRPKRYRFHGHVHTGHLEQMTRDGF
jgi:hypothetical protein